jgi:gas vesicle protein
MKVQPLSPSKINNNNMETTLIVLSVISTLAVVLLLWTSVSLRSVQKTLKETESRITDMEYRISTENEHIHHRISDEIRSVNDDLKKNSKEVYDEIKHIYEDLDKRFDNSYRSIYEFRDWAKEQIERLIENDLNK